MPILYKFNMVLLFFWCDAHDDIFCRIEPLFEFDSYDILQALHRICMYPYMAGDHPILGGYLIPNLAYFPLYQKAKFCLIHFF